MQYNVNVKKYKKIWGQLNTEAKQHSLRVAEACAFVALRIGLNPETAYLAGYLHDVGKSYIPSKILKKNSRLTKLEREIIDTHSYIGFCLLREIGEPPEICYPALFHHGFTKCKLGPVHEDIENNEVMVYVHLVHAIDIYDARRTRRVYHDETAVEEIFRDLGSDWLCASRILQEIKEYDKMRAVKEGNQ